VGFFPPRDKNRLLGSAMGGSVLGGKIGQKTGARPANVREGLPYIGEVLTGRATLTNTPGAERRANIKAEFTSWGAVFGQALDGSAGCSVGACGQKGIRSEGENLKLKKKEKGKEGGGTDLDLSGQVCNIKRPGKGEKMKELEERKRFEGQDRCYFPGGIVQSIGNKKDNSEDKRKERKN